MLRNCELLSIRNGLTPPTHGVGSRIGLLLASSNGDQCPGFEFGTPLRRSEPTIILTCRDHRFGCGMSGIDALPLEWAVRHFGQRARVRVGEGLQRRLSRCVGERRSRRDDVSKDLVRGRCDCGIGRGGGREPSRQQVRPIVLRRDRVDGVVDGAFDHPHAHLGRGRGSARGRRKGVERVDRGQVPGIDGIGAAAPGLIDVDAAAPTTATRLTSAATPKRCFMTLPSRSRLSADLPGPARSCQTSHWWDPLPAGHACGNELAPPDWVRGPLLHRRRPCAPDRARAPPRRLKPDRPDPTTRRRAGCQAPSSRWSPAATTPRSRTGLPRYSAPSARS